MKYDYDKSSHLTSVVRVNNRFFIYVEFGSDLLKFCRGMFIDLVQIKYWKVIASLLKIGDKEIKMAFLIGLSLLTLSSIAHYFGIFIAPVQI